MIRSFFGLTRNPFDARDLQLLPQQQEIHDTLKVHCQQGGLCLVLGVPGTGKSVLKQSLQRLPDNQYVVASVELCTPTPTPSRSSATPSASSSRATPSNANDDSSSMPSVSITPAKR
jgi:type II secretory pathway predicted ATPase ExeA